MTAQTTKTTRLENTVRPYTWDEGSPGAIPGARLYGGRYHVFIPGRGLRAVADALHDLADEYEQEN